MYTRRTTRTRTVQLSENEKKDGILRKVIEDLKAEEIEKGERISIWGDLAMNHIHGDQGSQRKRQDDSRDPEVPKYDPPKSKELSIVSYFEPICDLISHPQTILVPPILQSHKKVMCLAWGTTNHYWRYMVL